MYFKPLKVHVYEHTASLSASLTKDNNFRNFQFASVEGKALSHKGKPLEERVCSKRSKFFHLRVDCQRQNENTKIPPRSVFTLKDITGISNYC